MQTTWGRVAEIVMADGGAQMLRIACPERSVPSAGRYVQAFSPEYPDNPAAVSLFASEIFNGGFLTTPLEAPGWEPGIHLELYGPLGRGFKLPAGIQRLALAAIAEPGYRLLPVISKALEEGAAVVLFIDGGLPSLPTAVEVHPLDSLPEAYRWADFLAVEVSIRAIADLKNRLESNGYAFEIPCPAQVLVVSPMPCAGAAECGVCSLKTQHRWRLVCKHGPVIELKTLL